MYTAVPACFPWFHASLEVLKRESINDLLRLCLDLLIRVKTIPFSRNFILGNRKKNPRGEVRRLVGVGNDCNIFGSQEFSNNEWCVSGRIVMVEKPVIVLPFIWTFAQNDLPQTLQILTVKLANDGLTRGYEFLVDNAFDVGKNDQHELDIAANLTSFFFRPRWIWQLPLRWLLLSLRFITIQPCFFIGYNIGDEVGVISGLFLSSLQTETRWASGRRSAVLALI